jgi:hypothetical protein
MWQILEKEMIVNAKSLEMTEAINIAHKIQ